MHRLAEYDAVEVCIQHVPMRTPIHHNMLWFSH